MKINIKKINRFLLTNKLVISISLIVAIGAWQLCCYQIKQVTIAKHNEYKSTNKAIGKNLGEFEEQIKKTLIAASYGFKGFLRDNPNPSPAILKSWAKRLEVAEIEIFQKVSDTEAKMISYSMDDMLSSAQKDFYTKNYKLTEDEQEQSMLDYSAKYEPFRRDDEYSGKILHSTMVVWYKDIGLWLNTQYLYKDIEDFLRNSLNVDPNIRSISISSPSGIIMFSTSVNNWSVSKNIIKFDEYKENVILRHDGAHVLTHAPAGEVHSIKSFQKRFSKLLTPDGEYFYVLNVEFDNQNLITSIQYLKGYYFIIGILIVLLIWLLRYHFIKLKNEEKSKRDTILFVSQSIYHDLSQPIHSMLILWQKIVMKIKNAQIVTDNECHSMSCLIEDANNVKSSLIESYLNKECFSEMSSMKKELNIKDKKIDTIEIYNLLEEILNILQAQYSEVKFSLTNKSIFHLKVFAYKTGLKRALRNLIINAVESTVNNDIREIQIEITLQKAGVIVTIQDNGKGIPEDIMIKLNSGYKISYDKDNGHGFGFMNAKLSIEGMGGALLIGKSDSSGTVQHITLLNGSGALLNCGLNLGKNITLVISDDYSVGEDTNDFWRSYLGLENSNKHNIIEYSSAQQLIEHLEQKMAGDIYIIDNKYNNENISGIDIIIKYNLYNKAILITGEYISHDFLCLLERHNISVLQKCDLSNRL